MNKFCFAYTSTSILQADSLTRRIKIPFNSRISHFLFHILYSALTFYVEVIRCIKRDNARINCKVENIQGGW